MVRARMDLMCRQDTLATSAPAIAADQVVDLSSALPAPPLAEHHLTPPARPLPHGGIFATLACLLAGPALLALQDLRKRLRKGKVGGARSDRHRWRAIRCDQAVRRPGRWDHPLPVEHADTPGECGRLRHVGTDVVMTLLHSPAATSAPMSLPVTSSGTMIPNRVQ